MAFMFFSALEARLEPYFPRRKTVQTDPIELALQHSNNNDFYPPFVAHAARIRILAALPLVSEPHVITPTEVLPVEDLSTALTHSTEPLDASAHPAPIYRGKTYDRLLQNGTKVWNTGRVSAEELAHTPPSRTSTPRRNRAYSLFSDPSQPNTTSTLTSRLRATTSYTELLGLPAHKEKPSRLRNYLHNVRNRASTLTEYLIESSLELGKTTARTYDNAISHAYRTAETLVGKLIGAIYARDYARQQQVVPQPIPIEPALPPVRERTPSYSAEQRAQPYSPPSSLESRAYTPSIPSATDHPNNVTALDAVRRSRARLAQERAERMSLLQKHSYAQAREKPKTERSPTPAYNEPFTKPRVSSDLFNKKEINGVSYLFAKNVSYTPQASPAQEPATVYAPATLRTRPNMSIQEQIKNRRSGKTYSPQDNSTYSTYSRAA